MRDPSRGYLWCRTRLQFPRWRTWQYCCLIAHVLPILICLRTNRSSSSSADAGWLVGWDPMWSVEDWPASQSQQYLSWNFHTFQRVCAIMSMNFVGVTLRTYLHFIWRLGRFSFWPSKSSVVSSWPHYSGFEWRRYRSPLESTTHAVLSFPTTTDQRQDGTGL